MAVVLEIQYPILIDDVALEESGKELVDVVAEIKEAYGIKGPLFIERDWLRRAFTAVPVDKL